MSKKGFTLIELLVVVAIIGLLASVILASLNSARAKGSIASIKSNMLNMISAAELSYYAVSPNNYSGVCAGVSGMLTAITKAGGTASCYGYDNTRWGVSAKLNSDTTKNYSVDSVGVVTWDTVDQGFVSWDAANIACAAVGGRLPSLEQLKALSLVYGSVTPSGFHASRYWSGTVDPADATNSAYNVYMDSGLMYSNGKVSACYVRCVR